jgi:hypothetical protein
MVIIEKKLFTTFIYEKWICGDIIKGAFGIALS